MLFIINVINAEGMKSKLALSISNVCVQFVKSCSDELFLMLQRMLKVYIKNRYQMST